MTPQNQTWYYFLQFLSNEITHSSCEHFSTIAPFITILIIASAVLFPTIYFSNTIASLWWCHHLRNYRKWSARNNCINYAGLSRLLIWYVIYGKVIWSYEWQIINFILIIGLGHSPSDNLSSVFISHGSRFKARLMKQKIKPQRLPPHYHVVTYHLMTNAKLTPKRIPKCTCSHIYAHNTEG